MVFYDFASGSIPSKQLIFGIHGLNHFYVVLNKLFVDVHGTTGVSNVRHFETVKYLYAPSYLSTIKQSVNIGLSTFT